MKHIKNESRSDYLEFLRGFELKKRKFNIDSKNRVVLVIPLSFVEVLLEKSGENFEKIVNSSKYKGALSYIGEKLSFDHSLFTSFFESSLNDIISHIKIKIIFNADITFADKGRMIGRYEPLYLSVYISGEKSPLSVDEEGCILLGKVKIESEHGMWPEKVFVKTKMEIAGTEIKVTATMHTGEQVTAMFDFL